MTHDHDHDHAPANFNRAFAIGIALNAVFVAIEAFYGWRVNSLALLAWGGALAWEAMGRLLSTQAAVHDQGVTIMVVAGVGIDKEGSAG